MTRALSDEERAQAPARVGTVLSLFAAGPVMEPRFATRKASRIGLRDLVLVGLLATSMACQKGCSGGAVRGTESAVQVDAALAFPRAYAGETVSATFVVTATRTGPVRVASVSTSHPELSVAFDPADGSLPPGGTLPIAVTWRPERGESLDTTIEVQTDVEGSERWTVHATGEALAIPTCDDANACTDDHFERPSETCVHTNHARSCDDGNACTTGDRCQEGSCRGMAASCEDDDVCTLDLCDPTSGCVHPPDGRRCDDGDPCTKDVCDRSAGCSHPDADNGTACGSFSCAEAHVCVAGACRALDITGSSDGYPCSDGDRCTENDACQNGQCVAGPRKAAGPHLVASLETFGGEGSFVATDGYRYLFADTDVLRVAVREADNRLHLVSKLAAFSSSMPPVLVLPGKFAVAHEGVLSLVDLTDPLHPAALSNLSVDASLGLVGRIVHLARMNGGIVCVLRNPDGGDFIVHVDVDETSGLFGTVATMGREEWVYDLDADGNTVVIASRGVSVKWAEWLSSGTAIQWQVWGGDVRMAPFVGGVSIQGHFAALLVSNRRVAVVDLDRPEASLEVIDTTTNVNDVVLDDGIVYVASDAGIFMPFGDRRFYADTPVAASREVDSMPAWNLDRGPGHLLASGTVALPLLRSADSTFVRVTGEGHGDLTAVTDDVAPKVLLAGPMAVAELDLADPKFVSHHLADRPASQDVPRVLRGATRDVPLNFDVPLQSTSSCEHLEYVEPTGAVSQRDVCPSGLGTPRFDIAGRRLWRMVGILSNGEFTMDVAAWGDPFASSTRLLSVAQSDRMEPAALGHVRAADSGEQAAFIWTLSSPNGPEETKVWVPSLDGASWSTVDLVGVDAPAVSEAVGLDGNLLLVRYPDHLSMFDLASSTVRTQTLPNAAPAGIAWMAHGTAWVVSRNGTELTELQYAPTGTLVDRGSVQFPEFGARPGFVSRVYDAGTRAVVTTPHAVHVIDHACR